MDKMFVPFLSLSLSESPHSESIFADFLLQYATCEDKIRNLLGQILTEQQKLLVCAPFMVYRHM